MLLSNRTVSATDWLTRVRQETLAAKKLLSLDEKTLHVRLRCGCESVLEEIWRSGGFGKEGEESTVGVNGM